MNDKRRFCKQMQQYCSFANRGKFCKNYQTIGCKRKIYKNNKSIKCSANSSCFDCENLVYGSLAHNKSMCELGNKMYEQRKYNGDT